MGESSGPPCAWTPWGHLACGETLCAHLNQQSFVEWRRTSVPVVLASASGHELLGVAAAEAAVGQCGANRVEVLSCQHHVGGRGVLAHARRGAGAGERDD